MSCAVRPGTFFNTTERPPNRLAEPGSTCRVVTPPFISAREKPGSCGQTLCSAQTSGRTGEVASLPSERAYAGRRIVAEMAVNVDDTGGHELAGAIDLHRSRRRSEFGPADLLDHPVTEHDGTVGDLVAVAVDHRRMADDGQDAGIALVGRRIGILIDPDRRRGLGLFL